jgi:hypothetical protein
MIYHQSATGQWVPEMTLFGNPKMRLDFLGRPVIRTDVFGDQIVAKDASGAPLVPVMYPASSKHSDGGSALFFLVPIALLMGGLYSVFATAAGEAIVALAGGGILGMLLVCAIADGVKAVPISNGVQPPFYVFSVGWTAAVITFWITFFFNMNFAVSNTNYLTWQDMTSSLFPKMGLLACVGFLVATLFSLAFRSDMYAVRNGSEARQNRKCVIDMAVAGFLPPVLAVAVSLILVAVDFVLWLFSGLFSSAIPAVSGYAMMTLTNRQATIMAVVFAATGAITVVSRSVHMVRG